MPLEADYVAALAPLTRAFGRYGVETGQAPVLVGGAATAIHTGGAFPSGDFDMVATLLDAFRRAMTAEGFLRNMSKVAFKAASTTLSTLSSATSRFPAVYSMD